MRSAAYACRCKSGDVCTIIVFQENQFGFRWPVSYMTFARPHVPGGAKFQLFKPVTLFSMATGSFGKCSQAWFHEAELAPSKLCRDPHQVRGHAVRC